MRKLVTALIVVPLLIIFVTFAVANRASVTVTFDPFDSVNPALAVTMPLFLLILTLIAFGIIVGGIITWFGERKWRVRARRAEQETASLREKLQSRQWPVQPQLPPGEPARSAFPPAA